MESGNVCLLWVITLSLLDMPQVLVPPALIEPGTSHFNFRASLISVEGLNAFKLEILQSTGFHI